MEQKQECPLCGLSSTYTHETVNGKTVKKILCPNCKRLVFEEDTEERISSSKEDAKAAFIGAALSMDADQVLVFRLDQERRSTSTGLLSITLKVVRRSDYC